jgi:hypothetical protein
LWYVATPARSVTPTVTDDDITELLASVAVMVYCPAVPGAVYVTGDPLGDENVPQVVPLQLDPVAVQFTPEPSLDVAVRDKLCVTVSPARFGVTETLTLFGPTTKLAAPDAPPPGTGLVTTTG